MQCAAHLQTGGMRKGGGGCLHREEIGSREGGGREGREEEM